MSSVFMRQPEITQQQKTVMAPGRLGNARECKYGGRLRMSCFVSPLRDQIQPPSFA